MKAYRQTKCFLSTVTSRKNKSFGRSRVRQEEGVQRYQSKGVYVMGPFQDIQADLGMVDTLFQAYRWLFVL